MWNRQDLKARGKLAFKANYWKCVVVSILLSLAASGGFTYTGRQATSDPDARAALTNLSPQALYILLGILGVTILIALILSIFVFHPLEVSCQRFFKENAAAPADWNELKYGFVSNYKNVVLTVLLRNIFLTLWSLLFLIPGLIKTYSYRMVPYILADNPDMKPTEAITLSRQMMDGQKWNAFILDLSFIGWILLSCLTCGILSFFYVAPYMNATYAELYLTLKSGNAAA